MALDKLFNLREVQFPWFQSKVVCVMELKGEVDEIMYAKCARTPGSDSYY